MNSLLLSSAQADVEVDFEAPADYVEPKRPSPPSTSPLSSPLQKSPLSALDPFELGNVLTTAMDTKFLLAFARTGTIPTPFFFHISAVGMGNPDLEGDSSDEESTTPKPFTGSGFRLDGQAPHLALCNANITDQRDWLRLFCPEQLFCVLLVLCVAMLQASR